MADIDDTGRKKGNRTMTVQPRTTLQGLLDAETMERLLDASDTVITFLNHAATLPAEKIEMLAEILQRELAEQEGK